MPRNRKIFSSHIIISKLNYIHGFEYGFASQPFNNTLTGGVVDENALCKVLPSISPHFNSSFRSRPEVV